MKRNLYILSFGLLIVISVPSIIRAQSGRCALGPITSGSEIDGRVLIDINNLLFTVKDAEVQVNYFDPKVSATRAVNRATTDANGRFRLTDIKPGNYVISVDAALIYDIDVELNALSKPSDKLNDGLVEFVLGTKEREKCGGGYVRAVKSFDDRSIAGESVPNEYDQITEISLEHKGCFGPCPIYKVTLRKDGSASYIGRRFGPRNGSYRGAFYVHLFIKLAELIYRSGFFTMKDAYRAPFTDLDTMVVVVTKNGKQKSVLNYGGVAPIEIWGIGFVVDAMTEKIKWRKE